jgi:subtilisin family serine protease
VDQGVDGQWWFKAWGMEKVWDEGARGQGITVAVIDSGVQADRAELRGVVLEGTDSQGGDGRTDSDIEVGGHGTLMSILIAGQGGGASGLVGVAPEAKILPVHRHSGSTALDIRWAVDNGADVINMSYAGGGFCDEIDASAVRYALEHNVILVSSSGNDEEVGIEMTSPAVCPGVVAVGAVDSQLRVWEESSQGPEVALAAPGVHMVIVKNDGVKTYTKGTSDSSALVSGVMALVWSAHPELSNRQVVARVLATAKDLGPAGRDESSGFGVALPYQAVTEEVPLDAPNPVFDAAGVAGSAVSSESTPGATESGEAGSAGGVSPVVWGGLLGVGAGVVVLAVVGVVVLARRRGGPPPPPPGVGGPPPPPGR